MMKAPSRDERGATAVILGLSIAVLLAALGMSVDVGNAAYQRNEAQDAVDAAARNVATACGKAPASCTVAAATTRAQGVVDEALGGDTAPVTATIGTSSVKVSFSKNVPTPLLNFVGIESKPVAARATATWNNYPISGDPVLPLGVSYCTWKNNSGLAGTSTEANAKFVLRTDTLQSVASLLAPITGGLLSAVPLEDLMNSIAGTDATARCAAPDQNQILTLNGAVWLTGETVLTSTLSGLFQWNASTCTLKVGNDLNTVLGGLEGSLVIPSGCTQKFGPGKQVDVGKTILLPIYLPQSNLQNAGFKLLSSCVGLPVLSSNHGKSCLEVPPKVGVKIIGYAPFKVTGWKFPGTPTGYDTTGCSTKTSLFNLYQVINSTLTALEWLLNVVGSLLSALLGSKSLQFSLACNGLQGYFTKSVVRDPNFTYGPSGTDLGSSASRLSE